MHKEQPSPKVKVEQSSPRRKVEQSAQKGKMDQSTPKGKMEQSTPKTKAVISKESPSQNKIEPEKEPVLNVETPVKRPSAVAANSATSVKEEPEKTAEEVKSGKQEGSKEKPAVVTPRVTRRSTDGQALSKQVSNLRKSDRSSARGSSYDSDEGSTHARFLKLKKKKEDGEFYVTHFTFVFDDRVYKIQQGQKIEKILGVKENGPPIQYAVLYKGTAPKHQRMEYVPGKVLRTHAMEH
ncbi:hypothetical protein OESDEN_07612 [Oesophagostomum dentatum]|uniref:Uncharacterized protein n=1 Tax=Oesophagostomum dentatum TaxID=61180 RepID=A0A0B1T8L6_OESDE|nr:hypothetical protein OESDEN_07612 [Oesophagostomum dentatum]